MPEAAARYPYATAYHQMRRWSNIYNERKSLGVIRSLDELSNALLKERGAECLKYLFKKKESTIKWTEVKAGQSKHLMFWDEALLDSIKNSKLWHIDATYRAIPRIKKARQLMTIMGRMNDAVNL